MPDNTIHTVGNQRVARLDRDQTAESTAKNEYRPNPQRDTGSKETDTEPANAVTIEDPEMHAIRVRGQIAIQESDQRERDKDPAVAAVLAHAWTQISAGEE